MSIWSTEPTARFKEWSDHFVAQGADPFTAQSRALTMLYRDTLGQAQVLAYADEFWLFSMIFFGFLAVIPFMRRVRAEPARPGEAHAERVEPLPAATD